MIKLTTKQISAMNAIEADRIANDTTIQTALAFHSHIQTQIQKRNREFWTELAEIHNLDIVNKQYQVKTVDGVTQIIELVQEVAE